MGEKRLEELFDMMPTLRFILLGHPNMKQNNVQITTNGMPILVIPDYLDVSKNVFISLVNCAFDLEPLPMCGVLESYNNVVGMKQLLDAITTLGGCDVLEQRLRNRTDGGPLTPEEDMEGKYEWSFMSRCNTATIKYNDVAEYTSKGFSYAGVKEDGIMRTHLFRKKNTNFSNA